MMNRSISALAFIITIFSYVGAYPENIGEKDASIVAANFYYQHFGSRSGMQPADISPDHFLTRSAHQQEIYHVFNINGNGFVIVSAWDGTHPVLAAGDQAVLTEDKDLPPAAAEMLDLYARQIAYAIENQIAPTKAIAGEWQKWMQPQAQMNPSESVTPLISSNWDQSCYYNALCPYDNNAPYGYCDHVPVGCVAVSMGQIMNYHEYPASGTGSHAYYAYPYGMQSADFGNTTYNWAAMPDQVYGPNTAVATLLYHCGVSVEMQYGPDGSGAYTSDARNALVTYFNYSSDAAYVNKNSYSNSTWEQMLRTELDEGRPVIYRGQGTGGHAWVCDGYSGTSYFHMNWGWGGYYDGYFYLSDLTPGNMNFTSNQAMIKGIYPDQVMAQQNIELVPGWNSLSAMLLPLNTDPAVIFSSISNDLVMVQSMTGVYYPETGVNTIGNWDAESGYLIKVEDGCTLNLSGYEINDHSLTLYNGWNLIPVLSDCPVDTEELFAPVQSYIRIVKEAAGTGVYWPQKNINTLPELEPGKAYYVKIFTSKVITFPVCN